MKLHYWYENQIDIIIAIGPIDMNFPENERDPGLAKDFGDQVVTSDGSVLSVNCCLNFAPKVGDKVRLAVDEDDEIRGWILEKVE